VNNWIERLNLTEENLNYLLESNPSLRGMIMGYLAEIKLKEMWLDDNRITNIYKPDDHNRDIKADWIIEYKGKKEFSIEVKSVQTNSIECIDDNYFLKGRFQCDASDSREIEVNNKSIKTTCLKKGSFDIIAINLYPFKGKWEFAFAKNKDLPTTNYSKYNPEIRNKLLKGSISITYPYSDIYHDNPYNLLEQMY